MTPKPPRNTPASVEMAGPSPACESVTQASGLYRVRERKPGLDLIRLSELMGALFAYVPCGGKPDSPHVPEGEWYCEFADCDVREVSIRAKYHGQAPKRPPYFHCPGCGHRLKFHHYLRSITLLPVEGE